MRDLLRLRFKGAPISLFSFARNFVKERRRLRFYFVSWCRILPMTQELAVWQASLILIHSPRQLLTAHSTR